MPVLKRSIDTPLAPSSFSHNDDHMGAQQSRSDSQASQFGRLRHSLAPGRLREVASLSNLSRHKHSFQPPQSKGTDDGTEPAGDTEVVATVDEGTVSVPVRNLSVSCLMRVAVHLSI